MRISDLYETRTRLPFPKDGLAQAKDSYAAFVCVIDPHEFLRLTTTGPDHIQRIHDIVANGVGMDEYLSPDNVDRHFIAPYLDVYYPSGEIFGHEGRHRAAMVIRAGGDKFTFTIRFSKEKTFSLDYEVVKKEDGSLAGKHTETFTHFNDADTRRLSSIVYNDRILGELGYDPDAHWLNTGEVNEHGGGKMKGGPSSEGFNRVPWKMEDMVPVLIGQTDKSVRFDTRNMRYALIK